jgi:hypothetical protein
MDADEARLLLIKANDLPIAPAAAAEPSQPVVQQQQHLKAMETPGYRRKTGALTASHQ